MSDVVDGGIPLQVHIRVQKDGVTVRILRIQGLLLETYNSDIADTISEVNLVRKSIKVFISNIVSYVIHDGLL